MASVEEQNEIAIQARGFRDKVDSLLETEEERARLMDALRNYHESKKIKRLVRDLKMILDTIKKYPLFKEIRSLIPPEHLFAYDKLTEGARTGERIVHLKRHGNEPLGFKFKGGKEHGIGVYVTSIIPGSAAHASGLKIGDEILKINSLVLHESIHDEVTNLLKNKRSVTFVTKNMGKIPSKENNRIVWQEIDPNMRIGPPDILDSKFINLAAGQSQAANKPRLDDRMLAFRIGKEGLGCSIRSGIANHEGVYVSAITANSLAEQVGLKVGDQILNVNGRNFEKVKHSEAVEALKARRELTMIVRFNEDVAVYFKNKGRQKYQALLPILVKEGETKEVKKRATFGENVIVEFIENAPETEDDNVSEQDEDEVENDEPGKNNYEYDEEITQGREVQFVSILKTAPLLIDLDLKNERIVVRNVTKGGAVAENGFIKRGDVLLNVEGTDLTGLGLLEAQEILTEAMGRLAIYIDIIVACPPGRKPPSKPDKNPLAHAEDNSSTPGKRLQSSGSIDEDDTKLSSVAKAIAVFESNKPKQNEFLVRRDSLEKARNSLRLYKEKKRTTVIHSDDYSDSPKTTPSKTVSGSRKTSVGNSTSGAATAIGSSASTGAKNSAFSMLDPAPVIPLGRIQKQSLSIDSSEEEVIFLEGGKKEVNYENKSENTASKTEQLSSDFNPPSVSHFKSLSNPERDTSYPSQASNSHVTASNINQNDSSVSNKQPTQDHRKPRFEVSTEPQYDYNEVEVSPNSHTVRAQVHSPPLSSMDDMSLSWAPTSPLRTFADNADMESGALQEPNSFDPTSRSRSLDNLNETSPLHDRSNDAPGHRPLRKKSVGFRDTVENICPPDLTMYKSLDDISMIGKKGWARGKIHENPNMNLPSPRKSALRKSPNPSPVPTDRHEALTTDHARPAPEATSDFETYPYDMKRQSKGTELPSHLKKMTERPSHSATSSPSKEPNQGGDLSLPVANSQYQTYHELMAGPSHKQTVDNEGAWAQGHMDYQQGRTIVQDLQAQPGFTVPSQTNRDDFVDRQAHSKKNPDVHHPPQHQKKKRSSRDENVEIPEPDYERDEVISQSIVHQGVRLAGPVDTKPKVPNPPEVKPKKKDNSLGLTTRLLSNAKGKLKRVGFKRSSASGSSSAQSSSTQKSSVPPPPPPPPPPAPPVPLPSATPLSPRSTPSQASQQPQGRTLLEQLQMSPVRKLNQDMSQKAQLGHAVQHSRQEFQDVSHKAQSGHAVPHSRQEFQDVSHKAQLGHVAPHSRQEFQDVSHKAPLGQTVPHSRQEFQASSGSYHDNGHAKQTFGMQPHSRQGSSDAEFSPRVDSEHRKRGDALSSSMHTGIASEMTENVKIAAVIAGKDTAPRLPHDATDSRPPKHPPMGDLMTELKGRVKSQEARARSKSPIDLQIDASKDRAKSSSPAFEQLTGSLSPISVQSPTPRPGSQSDVRESRIMRRQAQGVTEVDSDDPLSMPVTPRSARGEQETERALREMEGTLKEFDDVIRSLDTEL